MVSEEDRQRIGVLPDRDKLLITELPEGYRVVGVGSNGFVVRHPRGRCIVLEQDGQLTGVTTRSRLAAPRFERAPRLGAGMASNPYTIPMD
jgi:hypothetical protein